MECSPFTKREQKHREPFFRIYGNSVVTFEQNPLHALTTTPLTSIIATLSVIANNYSRSGKKTKGKQAIKFISLFYFIYFSVIATTMYIL